MIKIENSKIHISKKTYVGTTHYNVCQQQEKKINEVLLDSWKMGKPSQLTLLKHSGIPFFKYFKVTPKNIPNYTLT